MVVHAVALIPARGGSKRLPRKNLRRIWGHSLVAYRIAAAKEAGLQAFVSTEDADTKAEAQRYGARVLDRNPAHAKDDSPDRQWLIDAMQEPALDFCDVYVILRPTSPFLTGATIQRALREFIREQPCHSLRAIRPVTEHPCKMWSIDGYGRMQVAVPGGMGQIPYHSMPTQRLPPYYVQTAGIEVAWRGTLGRLASISGTEIVPFELYGAEALDLNTEADWIKADQMAGTAPLPHAAGCLQAHLAALSHVATAQ